MAQEQLTPSNKSPWYVRWLPLTLLVFYLTLFALVLLPGASLLDRLRWLDSGICAQLPTHSFYPGGERLPLCARNTGIYLGFISTLIMLCLLGRGRVQRLPSWPITGLLICGVLALAIDGFNSLALDLGLPHLYQPHNLLRLATGLVTGLALAALTLPILNRLFWCEYNEQRSIPSWKLLLPFLSVLLLCFLAVASQSSIILYPVALLSTAGVLATITIINVVILIAVSRRDGTLTTYRELLPFLGVATLLSIGELLLLAQTKFSLLHVMLGMTM